MLGKLRPNRLLLRKAQAASVSDSAQPAPLGAAVAVGPKTRRFHFIPTVPLIVVGILLFTAVFAGQVSPHDPKRASLPDSLTPPFWVSESVEVIAGMERPKPGGSFNHIFGTDLHGRDIFSRIIHGTRIAVLVAGFVLVIATTIGVSLGVLSGYFGGKADAVIMRMVDIFLSFPPLLIAIVFSVIYGPSFQNVIIVISAFYWAITARQVRAEALAIKAQDFVTWPGSPVPLTSASWSHTSSLT